MPTARRHLLAIAILPGTGTVVIPALLLRAGPAVGVAPGPGVLFGLVLIGVGLTLMVATIRLLARVGHGTLAPWDATQHLVVRGPYRHVRNPMISGVLLVLLGEATALASWPLLCWFGVFFAANSLYVPLAEERGLVRRFGPEYEIYRRHVPRWLPRLRPWRPPWDPEGASRSPHPG